jgi:thiol-disulfide isomerase/thioredoxin
MTVQLTLFTAPWCAACQPFKPKVQAFADEVGAELTIQNVDDNTPTQVVGLPNIMLSLPGLAPAFYPGTDLAPLRATIKEFGKE